ncbi:MAG: hypothetical protein HKO66_13110 [Saprospiraceae bacterium]|nr:hypothetical protein [Bacteroidia bacterium]NNE15893.1 hypothetical protein [Saprospiraceae bacterium]NNL93172.1 hypothetical protein [Saprospiraceae bacterium]
MGNWSAADITAFTFLFLGSLFVYSLIKGIIKLLSYDWQENEFNAINLIKMFSISIISFILLLVFIFGIMPKLS